ncbi:hypothetical protein HPB51_025711 [Rhipicephalus microplus]|uniref:Uncharacterized protein n=1 Tax=Rhipicephalus microplus TaxID=6941 RepID=A0A9J6EPK6_RHIMP|nr:hypothetical protein HPB51_025711 [Rhipicephalus microplus]
MLQVVASRTGSVLQASNGGQPVKLEPPYYGYASPPDPTPALQPTSVGVGLLRAASPSDGAPPRCKRLRRLPSAEEDAATAGGGAGHFYTGPWPDVDHGEQLF